MIEMTDEIAVQEQTATHAKLKSISIDVDKRYVHLQYTMGNQDGLDFLPNEMVLLKNFAVKGNGGSNNAYLAFMFNIWAGIEQKSDEMMISEGMMAGEIPNN